VYWTYPVLLYQTLLPWCGGLTVGGGNLSRSAQIFRATLTLVSICIIRGYINVASETRKELHRDKERLRRKFGEEENHAANAQV
jgi:hypothetical protein